MNEEHILGQIWGHGRAIYIYIYIPGMFYPKHFTREYCWHAYNYSFTSCYRAVGFSALALTIMHLSWPPAFTVVSPLWSGGVRFLFAGLSHLSGVVHSELQINLSLCSLRGISAA
ncbi:unnamed protein product, partial [Scytosiphon promiscuus]